jgi:adenylate cyclase
MLEHYRTQRWDEAFASIGRAETLATNLSSAQGTPSLAALYDLYRNRIAQYRKSPPPENWDGVYVATFK